MQYNRPRKSLGQHFLQDDQIIGNIVSAISLKKTDHVVEIGPGRGALTDSLVAAVRKLDVIEVDRQLAKILEDKYSASDHFTIYPVDVLQFNFQTLYAANVPLRIIGNLPYNISTPLLFHLFSFLPIIQDMYFMLQKEVVDRLTASPGSSSYGRLSVMAQYHCQTTALFEVSAHAFYPPPKVISAIIKLQPFAIPPFYAKNYTTFSETVKMAFQYKRKTLKNNLKRYLQESDFSLLQINPQSRAETLSVEDFVKMSNIIHMKRS